MNNEKELRHRYGWTPAPTKPAYSQTNVSLAHKGRDYDALLRAAKRKPVGYWEDAPRGIRFGGGGNTEKASGLTKAQTPDTTQNATAPTTTPAPPQQSTDDPRAWKCTDGWLRCNVGANSFMRHPHTEWVQEPLFDAGGVVQLITGNSYYTELHGPERDAIIAECCAAMKLDPKTGEPLHA